MGTRLGHPDWSRHPQITFNHNEQLSVWPRRGQVGSRKLIWYRHDGPLEEGGGVDVFSANSFVIYLVGWQLGFHTQNQPDDGAWPHYGGDAIRRAKADKVPHHVRQLESALLSRSILVWPSDSGAARWNGHHRSVSDVGLGVILWGRWGVCKIKGWLHFISLGRKYLSRYCDGHQRYTGPHKKLPITQWQTKGIYSSILFTGGPCVWAEAYSSCHGTPLPYHQGTIGIHSWVQKVASILGRVEETKPGIQILSTLRMIWI